MKDKANHLSRRDMLRAGAAAAVLGSNATGYAMDHAAVSDQREVRLEYLLPKEIVRARQTCATIFHPLGTIEWHGVHNVVGVDSLKAHALCVRAARAGGGVVCPTLYGGVGGVNQPHTFIMDQIAQRGAFRADRRMRRQTLTDGLLLRPVLHELFRQYIIWSRQSNW